MSGMLRGQHGNNECDGKHSRYCAHSYRARDKSAWKRDAAKDVATHDC